MSTPFISKNFLTLLLILIIAMSCGPENKVVTPNPASGPQSTPITPPPVQPGDVPHVSPSNRPLVAQMIATIKSHVPACNRTDYHFRFSGSMTSSRILGPFEYTGTPPSGEASGFYVGMSVFNDLLIVSKLTTPNEFHITLSMCPYQNIIRPGVMVQSIQTNQGIVLNNVTYSEIGDAITPGIIRLNFPSQYMGGNQTIPVDTTFAKIKDPYISEIRRPQY
jgi:hypothetical protein